MLSERLVDPRGQLGCEPEPPVLKQAIALVLEFSDGAFVSGDVRAPLHHMQQGLFARAVRAMVVGA